MSMLTIPLKYNSAETSIKSKIREYLLVQKLNNKFGLLLFLAAGVFISIVIATKGLVAGLVLAVGTLGIPMLIGSVFHLQFGTNLILILSFFVLHVKRINPDIPLGLAMDILVAAMSFGLFIDQIYKRDWSIFKNPISKIILVWIIYNLIQAVNPWAESRQAWLYTVRGMAGFMVMYFIILYSLKDIKALTRLILIWVGFSFLGSLYGLYQEFVGFLPFEWNWLNSDPEVFKLIYIWGRYRIFSFFIGPSVFGLMMTFTLIICFVFLFGPYKKSIKILLISMMPSLVLGMLYSGTRAAYAVFPAALFFYALLNFNKKILLMMFGFLVIGIFLIFAPIDNVVIKRLQSAFKPTQDASYVVRVENQKMIQPYILSHPIGGGLGSTGVWGRRFSPNSELANFPPDSTYIRIAVELGWIGLLIYLSLLFTVFYVGIKNYKRLKNPLLKNYTAAMLTVLFGIVVANFPQEATSQLPIMLLFFVPIAIINKAVELDR
jgi:O-antigen ligase